MSERHVNFSDIGLHIASNIGHVKVTQSLTEIVQSPLLSKTHSTNELLSLLVYQQSAVIQLLRDELQEIRLDVAALRRDIKLSKTRVANARKDAAKAEEKSAKARERAAIAEASAASASEPTLLIQVGDSDNWEQLQDRIRRKF